MNRGALRVPPLILLATTLVTGVAGCGSPSYTYVKNSGQKTYFKVPANWGKINQKELDAALTTEDPDSASAQLRPKLTWSIAYDAMRPTDPGHLYGLGTDKPFVYAVIRPLTTAEQDDVSLNQLRDAFLPVTDQSRQLAAEQGTSLTGFELLRDDVLKPGNGLRGVRTTYNYRLPNLPTLQTFDVTAYASDAGRLYVMVLRCSARCYQDRKGELEQVASSFTVRKDT